MAKDTRLVYGLSTSRGETLIVLPAGVAVEIAEDYDALRAATTYGQARALQLTHVEAPGLSEDEDEQEEGEDQADDDPYDAFGVVADRYEEWPVSAATFALDHLPEDLDIGEEVDSIAQVPQLNIDPGDEKELIDVARRAGYTLHRDDLLIARLDY